MADPTPPPDPLRRLIDKAAPALRAVDQTISSNEALRSARDQLLGRAVEAIRGPGDVDASTVEGTVTRERAATAADPATGSSAAATPAASAAASGHFTRERLQRMAMAASREAVRPAAPPSPRMLLAGAALPLGLLLLWLSRRRR